jgi:hypothetical protein
MRAPHRIDVHQHRALEPLGRHVHIRRFNRHLGDQEPPIGG